MDFIQPILLILHITGVAMGAGGAIATDATFIRSIWDRTMTSGQLKIIEIISKVVISGLILLILSGAALIYLNPHYFSISDGNPVFWVKLTIVTILSLNGYAFHKLILPLLRAHADRNLATTETRSKLWLLALTGGLSGISWYSALALGVLMQVIEVPFLFLLNLYILLVIGAVMSGYVMIYWILFSNLRKSKHGDEPDDQSPPRNQDEHFRAHFKKTSHAQERIRPRGEAWRKINFIFVALSSFVLLIGGGYLIATSDRSREHFVCISEAPPWFTPDVLEIDQGDTVVWHHCGEDEVDYPEISSIFLRPSPVMAHEDEGDERHSIHTHPIYSISGPEEFSSDMGVVGHLEDGLEFRHTFTEEGIYEYICPTHPYMKGIIAVGEPAPVDSLWPPSDEGYDESDLLFAPEIPGVGEIWLNTQFERIEGQEFPGTITVLDGRTWQTTNIIADKDFNNPHNLWNTGDNRYIFQTQWHNGKVSKIDVATKQVVDTVSLGNAPAHLFVHPDPNIDKIYVTLNNESRVVIINSDLEQIGEIETSFGPHGIWIDPNGRWMSVAATLSEKLDIIDLETEEVVATFDAPGLPLATQITHDGKYAMISLLLEGKVRFIDLATMEIARDVEVGQMPVWAMPGPNGEYVFVPNTGTGDVSVISLDTLDVIATLPAASGAHGIAFGPKEGGGYYGYVSNKYARVVSVIDVDNLETIGHIPLHEGGWGGNGILTIPNNYAEFIAQ